jgi:hypothetical protein
MFNRRRLPTETLQDRLASYAQDARETAEVLPPGAVKDALLLKVRQADAAAHINEWAHSPGLQPPK